MRTPWRTRAASSRRPPPSPSRVRASPTTSPPAPSRFCACAKRNKPPAFTLANTPFPHYLALMPAHSLKWLGILLLLPIFFSTLAGCDADAADVRRTDILFDQALDAHNGAQAVTFLSKDSLKRLDEMLELARTLTRSKVEKLPFSD